MKLNSFALMMVVAFTANMAFADNIEILSQTEAIAPVSDGLITGTGTVVDGQLVGFDGTNTGLTTIDLTLFGMGPVTVTNDTVVTQSDIGNGAQEFHEVGTQTCNASVDSWCTTAQYPGVGVAKEVNVDYGNADAPMDTPFVIASDSNRTTSWTITSVPEPSQALLLGAAFASLLLVGRLRA